MTPLSSNVAEMAPGIKQTSIIKSTISKKPHLIFAATPVDGHTNPLIKIAEDLVRCGFEITFIGGEQFERAIIGIGASHLTIGPLLNAKIMAERETIPAGVHRLLYDIRHSFTAQTPDRWRTLKGVLEDIRAKDPHREVEVMPETCFMGANPISLGTPLPKDYIIRPRVVNLHPIPFMATSVDTGPFGPGLPPD